MGLVIRGECPHGSKCWLYYPEADCPFYRATVFSHYAPANCPPPDARLRTLCLVSSGATITKQHNMNVNIGKLNMNTLVKK